MFMLASAVGNTSATGYSAESCDQVAIALPAVSELGTAYGYSHSPIDLLSAGYKSSTWACAILVTARAVIVANLTLNRSLSCHFF